jgi:hypothetical protein
VRALDHLWVAALAYLAGLCTAALVRWLRYRSSPYRMPWRMPLWWCRYFHRSSHVAYSARIPRARWCSRCGNVHDWTCVLPPGHEGPCQPSAVHRGSVKDMIYRKRSDP